MCGLDPGDVVANFTAARVGEAQHSDAVAISALCAMVMSWPRLGAPCGGHSEGTAHKQRPGDHSMSVN